MAFGLMFWSNVPWLNPFAKSFVFEVSVAEQWAKFDMFASVRSYG